MEIIYKELSHDLVACFFEVQNELGVGYDEDIYHRALTHCLSKQKFEFKSKERKTLFHRNRRVRTFEADIVVGNKIILELKSLQSKFLRANYVQILSELKLWQMRLGMLVNFGLQKVVFERIPFTEKTRSLSENYDHIRDILTNEDRRSLAKLRKAILHVFEVHGLGYGKTIYQKLVKVELEYRRINCRNRFPIVVNYENEEIGMFKMKPLLIEGRLVCDIKALDEKIDFFDIAKIQSYLRALNLDIGVVANFGKRKLEIRGVRT